jgi:acyl carrier protein
MQSTLTQTVVKLIAEVLDRDGAEIPLGASLRDDLAMDSLKQMTLFIVLEDEFQKSMQPEEVTGIETVQDVIDFIDRKLRESAPT